MRRYTMWVALGVVALFVCGLIWYDNTTKTERSKPDDRALAEQVIDALNQRSPSKAGLLTSDLGSVYDSPTHRTERALADELFRRESPDALCHFVYESASASEVPSGLYMVGAEPSTSKVLITVAAKEQCTDNRPDLDRRFGIIAVQTDRAWTPWLVVPVDGSP